MKHSDSELVEEIVEDVYEKLFHTERIGIYSKLLEIRDLLCKQPWEILRSIGLWGMPGIGKTTLAKAVFDHMSNDYDVSCFIENFDESYLKAGLYRLLEDKIGNILKEKFGINSHYIMTPSIHEKKLGDKRILVVLDDVRDSMAAESFLGKLDCFGPGSLVIMTSRDKQVFPFCRINQIYEVQGLKEHKALQMFSHIAFGKGVQEQNSMDLTKKVIDYANGNPLALGIYGQELKGKMSEMESVFLKLKQYPPQAIQDVFKSVYSTLGDNEKNILLDIACFFKGENVNYVVQMLEGCRYFPRIGIDVLVEKCLVTISENKVQMSNLIQDISQVIFNGEVESCTRILEPSRCRYLLGDGEHKATSNCIMVAEDIESISLDTSKLTFDVRHDAFKNMFNLRFLKIYSSCSIDIHGLNLPKGPNSLPCQLRLLHWEKYPSQSLPQDFDFKHLTELSMPYSHLQKLVARTKNLEMLKRIKLCHSQQLVELDLLSDARNIELIDLQGCTRLKSFPDMSELQHLRVVNLSGCTEIKRFSSTPPNIEELHLQGTRVKEIPICNVVTRLDRNKLLSHLGSFSDADHMDLESVKELVKVSSYDQGFGKLVHLNLKDCSQLRSLPDMVNLESLQVLLLSGCSELEEIKGFPRNMRKLYLGGTAIREMPQLPQSLEFLNAHGCKYLKTVRLNFEQLPRHYTFSNCYNFPPQMIAEFLEKSLTGIESLARAKQQELIKAPEVSICIPISARQRSYFRLQEGPITTINIAPSTRKALSGFAISVVVSFGDGDHDVVGLGVRCVCTWKTTNNEPNKVLERLFQCWAPKEAPKVEWDHIFVFYDTEMHPSVSEEDLLTWAREVKFEFYTVSWENKLLGANCQVKECDVQVITAPTDEIIRESEVVGVSEVLEARTRSHSFRKPHKFSSVTSKVRSKKTLFWKCLGCFSAVEE